MKGSITEILTVSELNEKIRDLLEARFDLLWVEGEVSNLRRPSSGHIYFTLKDEKSQIRAVIFRFLPGSRPFRNNRLPFFDLEEGMQITCRARLAVYAPRGEYQLILDSLEPRGTGALQKAYEQLKARLQAEGLFDASRKKPIPYLPRRIGVITSPTGAVIRDILNITARRFPSVSLVIAPVRVQGPEAPREIVQAIQDLHSLEEVDVLILARGGGSLEDLSAFNDESVARAIASSSLPVISAVGHETDFTIADFAADVRAPTPSTAAELAVPNRNDLIAWLAGTRSRLYTLLIRSMTQRRGQLVRCRERLKDPQRVITGLRLALDDHRERGRLIIQQRLSAEKQNLLLQRLRLQQAGPLRRIRETRLNVEDMEKRLISACRLNLDRARKSWTVSATRVDSLSPLAVLERGYSIARTLPGGRIIRDVAMLKIGDSLELRVRKGRLEAEVTRIIPE